MDIFRKKMNSLLGYHSKDTPKFDILIIQPFG